MEGPTETTHDSQPQERVVLSIIITKEGQVKVTSPLMQDEIACYGLLQKAHDLIHDAHKQAEHKIIRPQGNMLDALRNGRLK